MKTPLIPETEEEKKRRYEHEERMRQNAISRAIDNCEIPGRYRGMRFSNYKTTTKPQTQVKKDCIDFLIDGTYDTGLMMIGKNGTGKTMLACIILQELIVFDPNNRLGYLYTEAGHQCL